MALNLHRTNFLLYHSNLPRWHFYTSYSVAYNIYILLKGIYDVLDAQLYKCLQISKYLSWSILRCTIRDRQKIIKCQHFCNYVSLQSTSDVFSFPLLARRRVVDLFTDTHWGLVKLVSLRVWMCLSEVLAPLHMFSVFIMRAA